MYSPPDLVDYITLPTTSHTYCPVCSAPVSTYRVERSSVENSYVLACSGTALVKDETHPILTETIRCPMEYPDRPFYQPTLAEAKKVWDDFAASVSALQKRGPL